MLCILAVSCRTATNPTKIFNPQGMYIINRSKGKVELYSKDKGTNTFSYYGWKDLGHLEGYSLRLIDWSKDE